MESSSRSLCDGGNVPLMIRLLEWAYDLKDYEISGPDWIKSEERYDIIAKAAGPASNEQMRPMLQTLLDGAVSDEAASGKEGTPRFYALVPRQGACRR